MQHPRLGVLTPRGGGRGEWFHEAWSLGTFRFVSDRYFSSFSTSKSCSLCFLAFGCAISGWTLGRIVHDFFILLSLECRKGQHAGPYTSMGWMMDEWTIWSFLLFRPKRGKTSKDGWHMTLRQFDHHVLFLYSSCI